MKCPKFTTGEWLIAGNNFVYALNSRGVNRFECLIKPGKDDEGNRTSESELAANAHLIAAAPKLYEALNAVEKWEKIKDGMILKMIKEALTLADGK